MISVLAVKSDGGIYDIALTGKREIIEEMIRYLKEGGNKEFDENNIKIVDIDEDMSQEEIIEYINK